MTSTKRTVLMILGALAALLIVSQLVMGLLLANGRADLRKSHQHTGYLTVVVSLIYIGGSLIAISSTKPRDGA